MTTSSTDFVASAFVAFPAALPALVILLKMTCVLLAALAVTVTMQRAPAGSRHLVWLVALGALLLLPALAAWGPLPIRVLPERFVAAAEADPVGLPAEPSIPGAVGSVDRVDPSRLPSATPGEVVVPKSFDIGSTLLALWALGALLLVGRLAHGAWSVRRIVRRARLLEHPDWQTPLYQIADRLGLEAAPVLLQSDLVKMPFAAGLFTPRIVLPAESELWSTERRSAVLIHELGHVRRRDLIGHTLSRIVCALYWFHPLVWTAARRLRAESERACDDLALVFGARPSDYAEHLLDIVTCVRDHNTPAVALAMAHRKEFEGRMLAILNPDLRRSGPSRAETTVLVGSLAALGLLVGAASPMPRAVPRQAAVAQAAPDAPLTVVGDSARRAVVPGVTSRLALPVATPRPAAKPEPLAHSVAATDAAAGPDDERAAVLARTLRTDSNAEVRRVAAWGLQRFARTGIAADALVAAVGSDADPTVREMAAWALASAPRNAAVATALVAVLRRDHDAGVRKAAVWALGSTGDAVAVEALTGVLGDTDPELREMAAWSIGSCTPDRVPAALARALSDSNRDVRLAVAWALYRIGDAETATALDAAFQRETDQEVQHGLIRALSEMGDQSIDALQKLVTSPNAEMRTLAITALAGGHAGGPWPWPRPWPRPFP
ncbi:MAG: HEAT repeat domain-containing protein [Gemmatimonadales bacterium]